MLLSAGSDVTFDSSPAEGAGIGCRAVAGIGRSFVGIASEVRLDAIEQRRKVWLITAVVTERVRHDDLIIRIHCSLRVVALDVAVLGLENSALGIGELRCAFGSGSCDGGAALRPGPGLSSFFSRAACSACALAFASASSSALASRIRTKRVCLSATQSGSSSPRLSGRTPCPPRRPPLPPRSTSCRSPLAAQLRASSYTRNSSPCAWTHSP